MAQHSPRNARQPNWQKEPDKMADGTLLAQCGGNKDLMLKCSPVPILYTPDDFPKLTANQLIVLNYLEQDYTEEKPRMTKTELASRLGWTLQQVISVEHQVNFVEARKALYTGKGVELGRHIPDIVKARIGHAKKETRGANQATRIVLETAGILGQHGRGATVQLTADEMHVSFIETVNVMQLANARRIGADDV